MITPMCTVCPQRRVQHERQLRKKCIVEASAAVMHLEHQIIELTNTVYSLNCAMERGKQPQRPRDDASTGSWSPSLNGSGLLGRAMRHDGHSPRFDEHGSVISEG